MADINTRLEGTGKTCITKLYYFNNRHITKAWENKFGQTTDINESIEIEFQNKYILTYALNYSVGKIAREKLETLDTDTGKDGRKKKSSLAECRGRRATERAKEKTTWKNYMRKLLLCKNETTLQKTWNNEKRIRNKNRSSSQLESRWEENQVCLQFLINGQTGTSTSWGGTVQRETLSNDTRGRSWRREICRSGKRTSL